MNTSASSSSLAEALRGDQRRRWLGGERVTVERYLAEHPDLSSDPRAVAELAVEEFRLRREIGESPDPSEYFERFPQQRDTLKRMLETQRWTDRGADGAPEPNATQTYVGLGLNCPFCSRALPQQPLETNRPIQCGYCHKQVVVLDPTMTLAAEAVYTMGRFQLHERLGSGQFGDVWRGYDSDLRRDVAIKIPRHLPDDPNTRELFLREARAAARIRHPHVVPVYEVGNDGNRVFIVSEFVRGPTLRQYLEQQRVSADQAARLCQILAEALEHAHKAGIVHRDLKPGNILLDEQGEPHIADFGIAKVNLDEMTITPEGEVVGTPAYMSPEQARGDARQADARADIYSLGVVLYEMLRGRRPFEGRGQVLIHQLLNCEPDPPSQGNRAVPKDLETICLKALAKDPTGRYATAGEMADDLGRFLDGEPIHARRRSPLARAWRWSRRNHLLASLAVLFGGAVLIARPWSPERKQDQPQPVLAPALTRHVALETEPPGAAITLFPISADTGEPLPEMGMVCHELTPLKLDLPPGDYLVVAVLDGIGFHEVIRHVPFDEEEIPWAYNHRHWRQAADGTILLPRIDIPDGGITEGMAFIEGADAFVMGREAAKPFEPQRRAMPSFYIDPREFTVGDHKRTFNGRLPLKFKNNPPADDTPLTDVDYHQAMHYAEKAGKRLLTEAEYEFAATARGTRKFPWGDAMHADAGEVNAKDPRAASFDRLETTPPVYGLASGVAEWTMSQASIAPADDKAREKRVIRGGGQAVLRGDYSVTEHARDPFAKMIQYHGRRNPGLGFRCVRSAKPRLRPEDFEIALPSPAGAAARK